MCIWRIFEQASQKVDDITSPSLPCRFQYLADGPSLVATVLQCFPRFKQILNRSIIGNELHENLIFLFSNDSNESGICQNHSQMGQHPLPPLLGMPCLPETYGLFGILGHIRSTFGPP